MADFFKGGKGRRSLNVVGQVIGIRRFVCYLTYNNN